MGINVNCLLTLSRQFTKFATGSDCSLTTCKSFKTTPDSFSDGGGGGGGNGSDGGGGGGCVEDQTRVWFLEMID